MGLLAAQKDIRAEDIFFMEEELADFKGGMTENYVNTQLIRAGFKPYFWRNDKGTKEVDFVISLKSKIIWLFLGAESACPMKRKSPVRRQEIMYVLSPKGGEAARRL